MAGSLSSGAKLYIGPITAANDYTSLAALSYTEIKGVTSIGDFGPTFNVVKKNLLDGSPTKKRKGSKDNGDPEIEVERDPLDAGQNAIIAAVSQKFEYAFKLVLEDSADANDTDSVFCWRAIVSKGVTGGLGSSDSETTRTFALGIVSEIFEQASTVVP